ncbi:MAG: hypothetical protein M5R40_07210 [Anaerolineae bacterium]|nr:hypothetical protein [Anaerolineae bacterium]
MRPWGKLRGALTPPKNRLRTVRSLKPGEWAFVEKRALCAEPGTWRLRVYAYARLHDNPGRLDDRLRVYCYATGPAGEYFVCEEEIGDHLVAEDPFVSWSQYPVYVTTLEGMNACCRQLHLAAGR